MKCKNHPSILTIQAKYKSKNKISFTEVTTQEVEKEIFNLETTKASQISGIRTNIIKGNVDVFADFYALVLIALLNLLCFRLVLNLQM